MAFTFREEEEDEEEEETEEEPEEEEEEEGPAETLIRHRHSMDTIASSSSPWNFTEEESSGSPGMKPSDLYGKFTWKIENFSQISKRELRSNLFEVGGCKWYILVYPQGCDVCNHLSLFLCVADYDKLLPGWSHFAQFTIAVVNKNPKKSKYSDTLHRFCKKEHDWGWKKFMELSKVLDGFTVAETLVIKAQVQVIREDPHRPFRCLDYQYRRELVRVYLTNIEAICRRFVEEKREKIGKLIEDSVGWSSFQAFWSAVEGSMRRRLSRERVDIILKSIVKCFFNQKEVTSPLVIDALYSGYRALDYQSKNRKGKVSAVEMQQAQKPIVWVDKDFFVLADDVLLLLERALNESMPFYKDEKGPQNRTKDGCSGDGSGKDNLERDERRLTELGRRTVEMFVLGHLFSNRIEVAYLEAIALKRQEELIREEEAAEQAEIELKARREVAEKEKRNKKKQAKQRRNDRKEKDKMLEGKHVGVQEPTQRDGSTSKRATVSSLSKGTSIIGDNEDDDSTILVDVGGVVSMLIPATEDGEVDQLIWEREASEMEATFSGASCLDFVSNDRTNRKHEGFLDDSSSTCSSDSILSLCDASNGPSWKRSSTNLGDLSQTSASRSRGRVMSDKKSRQSETGVSGGQLGILEHIDNSYNCNCDPETEAAFASLKKRAQSLQHSLSEKEELVGTLQKQLRYCRRQVGTNEDGQEGDDIWNNADSDIPIREKTKVLLKNVGKLRDSIQSTLGNNVEKRTPNAIIEFTCGDGINTCNDIVKSKGRLINSSSKNAMETIESANIADFPSASSTNSVHTQSSRPSSAPDQPTTSRTAPLVSQQSPLPPQSARCVGTLDRLGVTATDFTSSSSMQQGSGVISYSNGPLNIIGNNSLLVTSNTPISQAESAFRTNDLPYLNTTLHGGEGEAISRTYSSVEQSDFPTNQLLVERAKGESGSEQVVCKGGQPEHQESSMGFTFGTVTPELLHSDQQQENQVNHHADDGYRSESQFPSQETRGNLLLDDHSTDSPSSEHNVSLTPDERERILSLHIASPPLVEHQRILSHHIASSPSSEQCQSSFSQHFISSSSYEPQRNLCQQISNSPSYQHLKSLSNSSSDEHLAQHLTNSSSNEHQRSLPQNITSSSSNEHQRNLSQRLTDSPSNKHQSNLPQYITSSLLNEQRRSESQHITSLSLTRHQRNLSQHTSYSSSNTQLSDHITSSLLDEHQSDPSQYITSSCSNQHQGSSSQHHMARHVGSEEASVSGATMSEEFPHLDIINELLDEDKFLRHDAHVYSPILPSYELYRGRIYTHNLGMGMNMHQAERGDNRGPHLDACTTFHQFSNALDGDHMHLHNPYSHSPLHHLISSPCGVIESIPEYHWQSSQEDLSNQFRNDMNMLIGYPIQTHLLIPDCPPYTLGQNGYPIYSPIKHP